MSINLVTFASDETTMRFREPYLTQGLNRKAAAQPRGIYRGWRLAVDPGAGDRTVVVQADPDELDHLAVYQTTSGYGLTIRKVGGDFLLSLTSYSSVTIVVTIYASYSLGSTTAAMIRTYTEAEFAVAAEAPELVVLGRVIVPSSGAVVAASVLGNGRTMAWVEQAPETVNWSPFLRNSSFEWTPDSSESNRPYTTGFWVKTSGAEWARGSTGPHSGTFCMSFTYPGMSTNAKVSQIVNLPVHEGQRIRVRLYKRMIQTASSGAFYVRLAFVDSTGSPLTVAANIDTTVDTDYEEIDQIFEVPAGAVNLQQLEVRTVSIVFPVAAEAIRVDDVEAWIETTAEDSLIADERKGFGIFNALQLISDTALPSDLSALLTMNQSSPSGEGKVVGQSPLSGNPPALEWLGRLLNLGSGMIASSANAALPRISTPVASSATRQYTLLWEATGTNGETARLYSAMNTTDLGGFVLTTNAFWNGTGWQRENITGSRDSSGLFLTTNGLVYKGQDAGSASPWTTWDQEGLSLAPNINGGVTLGSSTLRLGEKYDTYASVFNVPRLRVDRGNSSTSIRTLIWESRSPALTGLQSYIRVYRSYESGVYGDYLEVTANCYYDGTLWRADNTGDQATSFVMSSKGLQIRTRLTTAGTWSEGAWEKNITALTITSLLTAMAVTDGFFGVADAGANSNPGSSTVVNNRLLAKNMVKAFGKLTTTGSSSVTISSTGSFNITTAVASSTDITVTLAFPFNLATAYVVLVTILGDSAARESYVATINNQTASTFNIRFRDGGGSSIAPDAVTGLTVFFLAIGPQD